MLFIGQDHWNEFIAFLCSLKHLCFLSLSDHSITDVEIPRESLFSLNTFHLSDMTAMKRLFIGESSLERVKDIQLESLPALEEIVFGQRSCNSTDMQQIRGWLMLSIRCRGK